jgi:glutamate dehydrogenase (NAD(P)+)
MEKLSYASESSTSPWTTYLRQIDRVAPYLGDLSRWIDTLRHPKRALIVDIPLQMDDGSIRHFEGYRVQHNLSRGPGKGGIRYHPDVDLNEVMALSAWMNLSDSPAATPVKSALLSGHRKIFRLPTSALTARLWPGLWTPTP